MHVLNSNVAFKRKKEAKSATCNIKWMLRQILYHRLQQKC